MLHDLFHRVFPSATSENISSTIQAIKQEMISTEVRLAIIKDTNLQEKEFLEEKMLELEAQFRQELLLLHILSEDDDVKGYRSRSELQDTAKGPLYARIAYAFAFLNIANILLALLRMKHDLRQPNSQRPEVPPISQPRNAFTPRPPPVIPAAYAPYMIDSKNPCTPWRLPSFFPPSGMLCSENLPNNFSRRTYKLRDVLVKSARQIASSDDECLKHCEEDIFSLSSDFQKPKLPLILELPELTIDTKLPLQFSCWPEGSCETESDTDGTTMRSGSTNSSSSSNKSSL
ncbi:unnamed protein product [Thelazia callipaeda]|uniref:Transmembrane protein n=1 Tax=Thelazia callipaeda TaxID=103827 RepID=A0A0N5CX14_THECL|nr:unnamed protein product [Thelazia callipaeda]